MRPWAVSFLRQFIFLLFWGPLFCDTQMSHSHTTCMLWNGPLWPKIACYMLHQTSLIKNHMSHHFTVVFDISDEDYCSTITILMAFTLLGNYPKNVSFEFLNFSISTNFCQKCRRCSLRSKYCKMRLFMWFSNTVQVLKSNFFVIRHFLFQSIIGRTFYKVTFQFSKRAHKPCKLR